MIHLPELISDLGVILMTAAAVTLIFRKIKQPVVLGYLIAGFLVGPYVPLLPTVQDRASITVWAEIGVIVLLFGLGLEFSFKKLASVGKSASVIAIFEVIFMLGVGYLAGQLMDWNAMDSLFLGAILSMSSTTIIVRAFDELGIKTRKFAGIVFGVLIVEDVIAILLLVLLSTIAISQTLSGSELVVSTLRLGFFLVLWFAIGIYALPPLMKRLGLLLNDETALVVSLGLCLMMVIVATKVGFSPALGAFVMGSLLAETREGKRIEHLILPVKDLFAAVFFVSVGMMIDPKILVEYGPQVAIVTFLTIVGKFIGSAAGALLAGESPKHSTQVGMSLAQIGEFSFIIATLGVSLKVSSPFLYPIAVASSAITTFTTPYLIRASDPFYAWLEKKLPLPILERMERYRAAVASEETQRGLVKLLWDGYGWRLLLNTVLALAVFWAGHEFLSSWNDVFALILSAVISLPFLWAMMMGSPTPNERLQRLSLGINIARVLYGMILLAWMIHRHVPIDSVLGLSTFAGVLFLVFLGRTSKPIYQRLERGFIESLESNHELQPTQVPVLAPWDTTLAAFLLHPNSSLVGKTLQESKLKERFGITVALIERGSVRHLAPDRDWILMPVDRLFMIGSDDQLTKAGMEIERAARGTDTTGEPTPFGLQSLRLNDKSRFVGKTIRESGFREAIAGLIVGIERGGRRIVSPDSSLVLSSDDVLWVVGDLDQIREAKEL